jgi:hypothetical protein
MTPTDYRIRYGSIVTPPGENVITWAGSRQQQGRYPAFSRRGNREVRLIMQVEGTTVDDMLNNFNAADRLLENAQRYYASMGAQAAKVRLTVKLDTATNTSEYTVLAGQIDPGEWGTAITTTKFFLFCPVVLACLPFAEESADVTSSNAGLPNTAGQVTLANTRGAVATPGTLTLNTPAIIEFARFWAARRSRGTVSNFTYRLEGEATVFPSYTVTNISSAGWDYTEVATTTTVAVNGKYARIVASGAVQSGDRLLRWEITANQTDHLGDFRVFGRVRQGGTTSITYGYRLHYGTKTAPTLHAGTVALEASTTSAWRMLEFGTIHWPDFTAPATTPPSNLVLELAYTSGANPVIAVDCLLLVPVDEGYILGTITGSATTVYAMENLEGLMLNGRALPPSVYMYNGSNELVTRVTPAIDGGNLFDIVPGNNLLLFYLGNYRDDRTSDTVTAVLKYRPRYGFLQGTT